MGGNFEPWPYESSELSAGTITLTATITQVSPHTAVIAPRMRGRPVVNRATSAPMTTTVKPMSSLTNTSGRAQARAGTQRSRTRATRDIASNGIAKATSWKSKFSAACTPHDRPNAPAITVPTTAPNFCTANRLIGITASANRTA